MSTIVEVSFYNSFLLRKVVGSRQQGVTDGAVCVWPGDVNNPVNYPAFPIFASAEVVQGNDLSNYNWFVEESRIKGGFNNSQTELGPRAYLYSELKDTEILPSTIIYSGIFNSTTQFNRTNVFSVGENITRNLDPRYSSIQYMFASDTNLDVFQENKVSRALIDKDAIYSASGGGTLTSAAAVIGTLTPYVGDYGISKNPESFAYFGFRRYFTDAYRGKVMRLSRDGLTEISSYGMKDFFRDNLGSLNDEWKNVFYKGLVSNIVTNGYDITLTGPDILNIELGMVLEGFANSPTVINLSDYTSTSVNVTLSSAITTPSEDYKVRFYKFEKDKVTAGYDNYADEYLLSIQPASASSLFPDGFKTLAYDDSVKGWTSFYTYKPNVVQSFKKNFYTTDNKDLYLHYSPSANYSNFYTVQHDSSVEFIFNSSPSIVKNFLTVSYEGSNGWQVDYFKSGDTGQDLFNNNYINYNDSTNFVRSYSMGLYNDSITGQPKRAGFDRKENYYVANLINSSSIQPGEVSYGANISGIRGYIANVKVSTDLDTNRGGPKELYVVGTKFVQSS